MELKAVVLDMDGTIVDTGNLWIESGLEANKLFGFQKSIDEIKTYIGTGKKDDYCTLVKTIFNEKIAKGELRAKEGLLEFLEFLKKQNIKIAIATSSKMEKVVKRLSSAKIDINLFDIIVSGDIVLRNKPDPQIYITACKLLKIDSQSIIAIEDSDIGVKSALSAGLKTILIPDVVTPNLEAIESAFKICDTFKQAINFISKKFYL